MSVKVNVPRRVAELPQLVVVPGHQRTDAQRVGPRFEREHRVAGDVAAAILASRGRAAGAERALNDDGAGDRVGRDRPLRLIQLQAHVERAPLPALEREADVVRHVLADVAALRQIELRDALIAALGGLARIRRAEHRLLRQQAFGSQRDVAAVERLLQGRVDRSGRGEGRNPARVVGRRPFDVGRERHAIADERPGRERVDTNEGAGLRATGNGVGRRQPARTHVEADIAAQAIDARPRRNLDPALPNRDGTPPNRRRGARRCARSDRGSATGRR